MRYFPTIAMAIAFATVLPAQTAEELAAKNIQAHGGIEKLKAIRTLRMTGKLRQGDMTAQLRRDAMAPDLLELTITLQGMNLIRAYDGATGWQVSPFEGRKDPALMGEDDLRGFKEDADFYGPLADYGAKGNTIEYLGHDTVDGDDAYKLKVTLRNGDIIYYYLDPETYLEIRIEKTEFIHGSVRETFAEMGSYKLVDGVYFPFSLESGNLRNPNQRTRITIDKIEANVPMRAAEFHMPAVSSPGAGSAEHPKPPGARQTVAVRKGMAR
jgi:hypothetical protein